MYSINKIKNFLSQIFTTKQIKKQVRRKAKMLNIKFNFICLDTAIAIPLTIKTKYGNAQPTKRDIITI